MTTIDAAQSALYEKLGINQNTDVKKGSSDSLGQNDFLKLMTQLQNQDPMEPMENGEFMGQMAQFSTVSGYYGGKLLAGKACR